MTDQSHGGVLRPRRRVLSDLTSASSPAARSRVAHQTTTVSPAERRARGIRRSAEVVEAVRKIDTAPTPQAQAEIREWLQQAYAERGGGVLIGLFGHCYLGAPYVDHALDFSGQILDHYTPSQSVPPIYVPARPFAISEAYAYIEIYADGQVIPVRPDGSAVT